ncbi:hypothetical protein GW916_13045 [bacterium]|nr:hypothetical protein [bacterium]
MTRIILALLIPLAFSQTGFAKTDSFGAAYNYKDKNPRTSGCRSQGGVRALTEEAITRCFEAGYSERTCQNGRVQVYAGGWEKVYSPVFPPFDPSGRPPKPGWDKDVVPEFTYYCRLEVKLIIQY